MVENKPVESGHRERSVAISRLKKGKWCLSPFITQKEVAAALGISQKTVSRVVNGDEAVKPETRDRVLALLGKSGYTLNANARNLSQRRSGALGVLVAGNHAFESIYFLQTFRGINEVVNEHRYHLTFSVLEDARSLDAQLLQADGFVIFNIKGISNFHPPVMKAIRARRKATVMVQSTTRGRDPFVSINNYEGGKRAVAYLLSLRHERIAFMGLPEGAQEGRDRLRGYRAALKKAGRPFKPSWVYDLTARSIEAHVDEMLSLPSARRPTAVFCWSDHTARVLIGDLQRRGLAVPDDLSVVGFDDRRDLVTLAYPEITTMRQPFYELGRTAGEMLFSALAGEEMKRKELIVPELIVRQSCKALV
ncbi:MAG: LacI family DNA-binding transcriptional regulator [Planctomycetota bacterium]|jgi:DNA-binding LacI/PurR family transcriptional regulator